MAFLTAQGESVGGGEREFIDQGAIAIQAADLVILAPDGTR